MLFYVELSQTVIQQTITAAVHTTQAVATAIPSIVCSTKTKYRVKIKGSTGKIVRSNQREMFRQLAKWPLSKNHFLSNNGWKLSEG
jgi:hypothetical protein